MPRKPNSPRDDPEQSKRFIDMAHEAEADGSVEEFERAFTKVSRSELRRGQRGSGRVATKTPDQSH